MKHWYHDIKHFRGYFQYDNLVMPDVMDFGWVEFLRRGVLCLNYYLSIYLYRMNGNLLRNIMYLWFLYKGFWYKLFTKSAS